MKKNARKVNESSYILSSRELSEIHNYGTVRDFNPGDMLFLEGEKGNSLFFIKNGSVQTFRQSKDSSEEIIAIKGPGEIVGEISFSGDDERYATAQALEKVSAIQMEQQDFLRMVGKNPKILLKILGYLSSKVRDSDLYRIRLLEKKNEQILRSYEDLKNAQEELLKQERLAAVGSLASKIIHDIKGTITPLKVYSENLDSLTEEARRFGLLTIRQSIHRILRICEELLEYVRGAPIKLQKKWCKISNFIEREIDFLNSVIDTSNIFIHRDYSFDGYFTIDNERMGRVIQNILINAKDAISKGGTISIRTARSEDFILIRIADTGCGIAENMKEKIFEPFVTFGKKKGTGLGLSISRKIIEEHGGKIEVESEQGKGSTFTLYIPVNNPE